MNEPQPKPYSTDWELKTPTRTLHPHPGLYYYSGWGYGEYYSADGHVHWGTTSEAYERARKEGLTLHFVDSLEGYKAVYLGD